MPRDIRSYFTSAATTQKKKSEFNSKPHKRRVISSDEDEERPHSSKKRSKIIQKSKTVSSLSDSEDDITNAEDYEKYSEQSKISKQHKKEKHCKIISTGELFTKKPVTRVEETKILQKLQKKESEFHNDDDFDAVLKQLDTSQSKDDIKLKGDSIQILKAEISKGSKMTNVTEIDCNNSKKMKYDTSLEECCNEKSQTDKIKTKQSPSKKKTTRPKHVSNSAKQKILNEKNNSSSSNEDLDINNKNTKKTSKKLNLKILASDSVPSISKDETIEKQSVKDIKAVDLFEERIEKKKQRAILYEKYLQRGGARNPGSKKIPSGSKNCLAGVSFLITGVLDSLERNEAEELIRNYGGRIVNAVSGKVNYIIVGDEAGPAKLAKATSLGIEQISEDNLLEMIQTRPEGKSEDIKLGVAKAKCSTKKMTSEPESDKSPSPRKTLPVKSKPNLSSPIKAKTLPLLKQISDISKVSTEIAINTGSQPLVEKYRPKILKQIIGQQGDRSCANNLYIWLRDWYKNRQDPKFKTGTGKQTNGQSFKAALLSGPPGVGKTTTVQVVCKELGYDLLEFNASNTRNKTLLKEEVSGLLSNTTMKEYMTGTKQKITSKHVLLMDEVDGMAGNEDRGGLQELMNLIKFSEVPIVCICNDRFNTKVKTISCHSYDLRFPKLRVEQIRSSMKSLCFKEDIKISTEDLDRLIESTNYDIRQVINHLEFLGGETAHVKTSNKKHSNKNFKLGPFDVAKMAFNLEEQKNMTLNDKIGLYFHDYNIAPLFIQENYPGVRLTQISPLQKLERISHAADSISQGDLIEKAMRSNMMWSLLPLHACFSYVIPGNEMSGSMDALIRFPTWFGRNSRTTKFNRLMQELTTHTRLVTGASKDALNMDYLIHIRNAILKPLIDNGADGIEAAINVMASYNLMREDLDSMVEISLWPGIHDPMSSIDSKVKAAFTRAYQKKSPILPYAINTSGTTKKRATQDEDLTDEDDEEDNDNINSDKMIKTKKSTVSNASASQKKNSETTKKRGRGRGKTK